MISSTDMNDERRTATAEVTRICRVFEELGVTLPEMVSVSCTCRDGVCFKDYGKMPEEVGFFGSRRALPEGLHKFLPSRIEGVTSVIVINTTAESGDFSSKWRRTLKREADSDPFTIGDPVAAMISDLSCNGFCSVGGECFCGVGADLREAYDMMLRALEGIICRGKTPRLKVIRTLPELPAEGILGTPESSSLIYRERAMRSGGHRYRKLKRDNISFEEEDEL